MTPPTTKAGLVKFRPIEPGANVALVAPASNFSRAEFEAGLSEIRRLGFNPTFHENIFRRHQIVAGTAAHRAEDFMRGWTSGAGAVIAVRGGYGSMEILPDLDREQLGPYRPAFIGYSDVTSLHMYLNCHVGRTSIHGVMVEGRLASGPSFYDEASFHATLTTVPLGEIGDEGLETLKSGEATGPMFGGTLTQLVSSLGTPYAFDPPQGSVFFVDEVRERPYRLRRMLTQLRQSGLLARASALVFGQCPECDEPGGSVTARAVITDYLGDFPGPVVFGLPSGHTVTPLVSIPFGVDTRVVANSTPRVVFLEAAAG